jgi:hypothetical protein
MTATSIANCGLAISGLTAYQQTLATQTVEQVWFPGTHRDVGGGNSQHGLSDIAFRSMIDKAAKLGLSFDQQYLADSVYPDYTTTVYQSVRGIWR